MRKSVLAVVAIASIGYVAPASAQTQAATDATAVPAAATDQPVEDKKICVDQDSGGNSRLGSRKVCHTQKEWDSIARSSRR